MQRALRVGHPEALAKRIERGDKAAKELVEKEAPTAEKPGDLTGNSGFMDTRLAFTITNAG